MGDGPTSPLTVRSVDAFHEALNRFSGGLLEDLGSELNSGLVFAGGAVLHGLTGKPASDLDIFFIGGDQEAAEQKLRRVLTAVKRNVRRVGGVNVRGVSLELVRTRLCVTAYRNRCGDAARVGQNPP